VILNPMQPALKVLLYSVQLTVLPST